MIDRALALMRDRRVRDVALQLVAVAAVAALFLQLIDNAARNMARQNIATGFDYLGREAGFVISDALIAYAPSDSYGRALLVGVLNTMAVSALACLVATLIGVVVGILRLSPNKLLARLMLVYVEALRNVPLLLYLFLWYAVLVFMLPPVREAIELGPGLYLSNAGLILPKPLWGGSERGVVLALGLGAILAVVAARRLRRRRLERGETGPVWPAALLALAAPPLLAALALQPDWRLDWPVVGRFRFSGGAVVTSEFIALLLGLGLSASAAVAEIVRSGVQAVARGQWDAAAALGLPRGRVIRLVILPQTFRIAVPPMTSTYLNVTKNSSLAVAIGYPDLVSVSNTTMNQTGQAMEAILLFMTVYLGLSVATSLFMNWFNARVALKER